MSFNKKHHWILFILLSLMGLSCQKIIKLEKEKESIKSVIEAEIKASFYGDYKAWANLFVHEPYAFCLHADQENCHYWRGWEEIGLAAEVFISPERTAGRIYEGYYDYSIRIYKESAVLTFKTKTTMIRSGKENDSVLISIEERFLEKQDGEWKITYRGSYIQ